jgi:hypothetical protein
LLPESCPPNGSWKALTKADHDAHADRCGKPWTAFGRK